MWNPRFKLPSLTHWLLEPLCPFTLTKFPNQANPTSQHLAHIPLVICISGSLIPPECFNPFNAQTHLIICIRFQSIKTVEFDRTIQSATLRLVNKLVS